MALDPALAGLLGALVGGGFTFAGSIIGNTQQARHDRKDRLQERKVDAYTNAHAVPIASGAPPCFLLIWTPSM